jgi:hypothetical protein
MAQTFRQALDAVLNNTAAVTAIVGAAIYPYTIPITHDFQRDGPALTYEVPSDPHGQVLGGKSGKSAARVTLKGWSYRYSDVDALALALFDALNGPPGTWGDGSCVVNSVTHQDDTDTAEPAKTGSDLWVHSRESEYLIKYFLT